MKRPLYVLAAAALLLALALVSVSVGAVRIPPGELFAGLTDAGSPSYFIVHEVRLPRILVGLLAGAGLAVSGVILQNLVRNPLASPDVIGITKGAGFAAAAVIFLYPKSPLFVLPVAAFAGAVVTFVLLAAFSRRLTLSPAALALVGVAIGAVFQAGIPYLIVTNPTNVNMALLWMSGSLWSRGWSHVQYLLPAVAVLLAVAGASFARLNAFQLGDEVGASIGLAVIRDRFWLFLLAVTLAGVCVSAVGAIGFVGLLAPHIARRLVGSRNQWMLPLAALTGADLMLLGDTLGRILIIPREVPVGIMTAVLGGPYFIYLLRRGRKRGAA
ncbi:MAG: iron ABC transporter permease [Paenibacillaceae bacterium]|nr:iron ABC transporter permease [Paenibacillaceae bacterium]